MKYLFFAVAVSLLLLTGCAKRPDAIVPVDIPLATYSGLNCSQLASERAAEDDKLAALSKQQNKAANGDVVGVFLIGLPVGSAFGADKEGEVAVAKGKVQAIDNTIKSKGC